MSSSPSTCLHRHHHQQHHRIVGSSLSLLLLAPVGLSLKRGLMDLVLIFVSVRLQPYLGHVGPILFIFGTKTTHDVIHMHIILFHVAIKDGRLAAILVVKKRPGGEYVLNYYSDMHLPILFKLGTQVKNDGLHVQVIYFRDHI